MRRHEDDNTANVVSHNKRRLPMSKKMAALMVVVALICVLVVPVTAWFYYYRSIQTITKINAPNALVIGSGNAKDITQLELADIDVSKEPKYKDVVFCVYSNRPMDYHMQLAHTTNIGFTYTIYPATKTKTVGNILITYNDDDFYFDDSTAVSGGYLNQNASTNIAESTGVYHDKTYDGLNDTANVYNNVQKNAEPLYWKTSAPRSLEYDIETGYYINYYVLRISWDSSIQNNKETDMVYLMAEAALEISTE